MRRATLGMLWICAGCGDEGLTHEEAQAGYATLDHGTVGISMMLLDAFHGKLEGTSLVVEPVPPESCRFTLADCVHVSVTLEGRPEYDWEGSVQIDGYGGVYRGEDTTWDLTLTNLSLAHHGTAVTAPTAEMVVREGAFQSEGAPKTLAMVALWSCGADVAGRGGINVDYQAVYDTTLLFMDSSVTFAWETADTFLEEAPNGYHATDDDANWSYSGLVCP